MRDGCEWRNAASGMEKSWVTSDGLRIGERVLSVTSRTTLV